MTTVVSSAENLVRTGFVESMRQEEPGVIVGDPYTYMDGTTAAALRSGVDGPHSRLADRLCGLNGRLYE